MYVLCTFMYMYVHSTCITLCVCVCDYYLEKGMCKCFNDIVIHTVIRVLYIILTLNYVISKRNEECLSTTISLT